MPEAPARIGGAPAEEDTAAPQTPAPASAALAEAPVGVRRRVARRPGIAQPLADAVEAEYGTREEGQNRGPKIERWLARYGHPPGTEYCGAFLGYKAEEVGAIIPSVENPAWTPNWKTEAAIPADEMRHAPNIGWVALNLFGAAGGHVDAVTDTSEWPRAVGVGGGNVSSPDGDCRTCGVFPGRRSMAPAAKYRPEYFIPTVCAR